MIKNKLNKLNKQGKHIDFTFSVFNYLKEGFLIKDIALKLNVSKPAISYHINKLKTTNSIEKLGYGVWKCNNYNIKQVKQTSRWDTSISFIKVDCLTSSKKEVRGHAFMIKIRLPKLSNWKQRTQYFKNKKIKYLDVNKGQRLLIDGNKIHIYDKSIIMYLKKDFVSIIASDCKQQALYYIKSMITRLENLFKVSFKINKYHRFEVCKEHYALMQNVMAKTYNKNKNKLMVKNEFGYWLLIDNSYNLNELETLKNAELNENQAVNDNEGVQEFFNSLKRTDYKANPEILLELIHGVTRNQQIFDANMKSHIKAVKMLGLGVKELKKYIIMLSKRETGK